MKELKLNPDEILIPGEFDIHNERILQLYFRAYSLGVQAGFPKAVVVRTDYLSEDEKDKPYLDFLKKELKLLRRKEGNYFQEAWDSDCADLVKTRIRSGMSLKKRETGLTIVNGNQSLLEIKALDEIRERFEEKRKNTNYFLLDGNHKSVAAALTNSPVYAVELESEEDMKTLFDMIEKGEQFDMGRKDKTLKDFLLAFENYVVGYTGDTHIDDLMTVRERVDGLVEKKGVPGYMIKKYLAKKAEDMK